MSDKQASSSEPSSARIVLAVAGGLTILLGWVLHSASTNNARPKNRDDGASAALDRHKTSADGESPPFGLNEREAWTTSRVVGTPDPPPPFRTELAFPRLKFRNPVVLAKPSGVDRYFVAEQSGRIYSFANTADCDRAELALDVTPELLGTKDGPPPKSPVDNTGIQGLEALYGLAFHPKFSENRYCYVCYVVRGEAGKQLPDGTRVSRFRVTEADPPRLDPTSEQVVITWLQGGHNGGCLAFGPDGYLYISTGDGGFANPPDGLNSGQDVSNLLSSVLRIDVDHPTAGRRYDIPRDNPFVNLDGARGEIWCYGLRNPWKMSFDRVTGDLWVGDVGWELWELVYRVERGGNYGWSVVEGRQAVHPERKVGPTPILPPTIEIPHTDGVSITGGYVYRGKKFPELVGQYVFGDWETRRLWASSWDATTKTAGERRDLVEPSVRLVAFAEDDDGELFLVDYDDGTIHGLVRNETTAGQAEFPRKLSDTGIFRSTADQVPAPGVYPFVVNVDQWTDHATAERWIAIPDRGAVRLLDQKSNVPGSMFQSSMLFPVNTVLVKTMSLELKRGEPASRRRVETQLLHFDGKFWRGYSYQWNDAQTDAELVGPLGGETTFRVQVNVAYDSDESDEWTRASTKADAAADEKAQFEPQTWHFSSRVECARCHNQWAEYALAFNLRQLNRSHDYEGVRDNQLRAFEHIGIVQLPAPSPLVSPARSFGPDAASSLNTAARTADWFEAQYPRLVDPHRVDDQPLEDCVRSYLHVNCAHCHRTGGGGTAYIELRQEIPLDAWKAIDVRPTQGTFDIPDARIIAPGDPFRSTLYLRISKTGSGRMPHIGSEIPDPIGTRIVGEWIRNLPPRFDERRLVDRLLDADEPRTVEREAAQAETRIRQIAQRLANERRQREHTASGSKEPLPVDPATLTDADWKAARIEDERLGKARVTERAKTRRETIDKILASTPLAVEMSSELGSRFTAFSRQLRDEVVAAALVHPSPVIRDLFDPLAPIDKRKKRLAAHLKTAEILALTGDAARGAVLFANTEGVQCKNCHRIGRIGGLLGPDLSAIGKKYRPAQLLEHILEPSKLIEPKYVSYVVSLSDGRVIQGLLTARTADEFVLRDVKDREVRVAAEDVETFAPQRQSLMPDLLLRDLTAQQVADLLAYLAEQK